MIQTHSPGPFVLSKACSTDMQDPGNTSFFWLSLQQVRTQLNNNYIILDILLPWSFKTDFSKSEKY